DKEPMRKFKSSFRDNPERLWERIERLKGKLGWKTTGGMARRWWNNYESLKVEEPRIILSTLEAFERRELSIAEIFKAALYSGRESIEGTLEFYDFTLARCNGRKPDEG